MDTETKAAILNDIFRRRVAGEPIKIEEWQQFVVAQNDGYRTGREIGEKVPDFALVDQHGKSRTLGDLMGPSGLLLVFSRSAVW